MATIELAKRWGAQLIIKVHPHDAQQADEAYAIVMRSSGVGGLVTRMHGNYTIGYWCRTSMIGKGYATEAVRELTAAAFGDLAANRVEIRCDSRNHRSRRVAELAGFHVEAELRCDARANDGSLRDTTVYALLAEDFHPGALGSDAA